MVDGSPTTTEHPRIRTFHARHGRLTAQMRRALDELAPRYDLERRAGAGRPLVLEVGCGHGDAALAFADAHPDLDLLATDVHAPGIAHLLLALEADHRPNVFVARRDALEVLDDVLATASLAGVHSFFPDPWPKARHHKRRFVRDDVADLLADRIRPGGSLRVATDARDYAEAARSVLDRHPRFEGGPTERPRWRPRTGYEAKAVDAGRAVHELAYQRARG